MPDKYEAEIKEAVAQARCDMLEKQLAEKAKEKTKEKAKEKKSD